MDWIEITVLTTSAGIDAVCARLYDLGITGAQIEDEEDFKDFLENNHQYWDYVDEELMAEKHKPTSVKAYVSDNAAGMETLAAVKASIAELKNLDADGTFGSLEISTSITAEEDWANNWKQYYHTLNIGEKICVCPEWETAEGADGRVVFKINPGMSFGTGTHDTTRLCLESLEKYIHEGDTMLDLGCGSGILSIVSLLLGAERAYAVDIDPNARDIAYENAAKNGIGKDRYTVMAGNVLTSDYIKSELGKRKYDIVAANIVADVIISLTPAAREYVKSDGVYIVSGIIHERLAEVQEAITNNGFEIVKTNIGGEWAAIIARPV